MDKELVCEAQSTRVAHNVTFVVDCSYLADRKDLLAYDLGVWVSKGSRKTSFTAEISPTGVSVVVESGGQVEYVMHRGWHTHGRSEDAPRLVIEGAEKQAGEEANKKEAEGSAEGEEQL